MTRTGIAKLSIVVVFCFITSGFATSQKRVVSSSTGGPLTPFADTLRAHGFDTSEPSLLRALGNSDPEVRSVAALKLAEDHHFGAVRSIKDALASESNLRTRIAMSEAIWGLHDPKGIASLQAMCSDQSLALSDLVEVVQHLNILGHSSQLCADPVFRHLASAGNSSEAREIALPALPNMYRWVSPEEASQIVTTLQEMLTDSSAYGRLEAGHSLVRIKSYASADALRTAISRQTDSVVRSSLQEDLDELEKKE
jgi:hypothetical protein